MRAPAWSAVAMTSPWMFGYDHVAALDPPRRTPTTGPRAWPCSRTGHRQDSPTKSSASPALRSGHVLNPGVTGTGRGNEVGQVPADHHLPVRLAPISEPLRAARDRRLSDLARFATPAASGRRTRRRHDPARDRPPARAPRPPRPPRRRRPSDLGGARARHLAGPHPTAQRYVLSRTGSARRGRHRRAPPQLVRPRPAPSVPGAQLDQVTARRTPTRISNPQPIHRHGLEPV